MRLFARGAALSVLGVLFLSSTLFAQSLTVRVRRGNVRAGPGDTYDVIGKVRRGQKFDVEARQGNWFKILLETGREGWVFKSLVEVSATRTIGVVPSAPARTASSPYGDSWAIVVGINRYRKRTLKLNYAVNDAENVTAALGRIGFPEKNIITLLDGGATALAIRTAFNTLITRTRGQDRVFIFFATHGVTLDLPGGGAMGYLLPVEADPANIVGTAMPMSEIKDMARLFQAKHVFFAVDACFSGLLASRSVLLPEKGVVDAAYLTRGRLRQILTAGERDQPVLEEGGYGLFTKRLLEALEGEADNSPRDGVLTAMEVAAFVQGRVIASSSSRQTPFFGTMDGVGQFVFNATGIGDRPPAAPSPPAPSVTVKLPSPVPPPVVSLPKGKADLYVSSDPIGARVFIDGRDTGKKTPVLLEGISAGDRRVDTRKGDYMVGSTTVSVRRGVINRAKLKLEVLQGRLKVVSEPLEAEVFVGKKKVGRTPLIASVPGGPQVIRVMKPGYKPFERKLNISVRRSNRLMAVLAVDPIPRGMVKVPAGWFIMGSQEYDDEKPRRRVYLDEFFTDKYPVTNARFRRFGTPKESYGSKFNGDRQPVVGVTWFQARDYCKSVGKRLPTEAEWEKSARGVDGRKYSWGNDWDGSKVIWKKNSGGKTHPVDRDYNTHRSPYGAVDMAGNTWEWVSDWYGKNYYANAPERNPKGPASGTGRVLRGGSWYFDGSGSFRAAYRNYWHPDDRLGRVSFRCAKASNK